ncbi:MAG: hypothetical protein JWM11_3889 [Planctomycetaceae bacterium]|nr:hypothetical protein [Planctomycetaceae bacterium]
MHTLRFPDETDDAFRERAQRTGAMAKVLVEPCFLNRLIQKLLRDGTLTESTVLINPTVRVEYEQAIAIGGIGESLNATKNKRWGDGPWILPLEPDDQFFPERITYLYRENSLYNRRFEQRIRLKELMGKNHRKLVGDAKYFTKEIFLRQLTTDQISAIRRILQIEPGALWRAAQGKIFIPLPKREVQLEFDFSPQGSHIQQAE